MAMCEVCGFVFEDAPHIPFGDCVDYLKQRIADLEAERRWIPVGERLPKDGLVVLVMNDRVGVKSIAISRRDVGYWNNVRFETTHWMPLPAQPEEERWNAN